ncbi:hypothetical protein GQ44DRAFT_722535 [Phaeosphaeriaceae sp. PMI808]|nr:hypothetical protein GQ44DRAFT_722535 [Phaeosphaeriaceae sp. PMI808]
MRIFSLLFHRAPPCENIELKPVARGPEHVAQLTRRVVLTQESRTSTDICPRSDTHGILGLSQKWRGNVMWTFGYKKQSTHPTASNTSQCLPNGNDGKWTSYPWRPKGMPYGFVAAVGSEAETKRCTERSVAGTIEARLPRGYEDVSNNVVVSH